MSVVDSYPPGALSLFADLSSMFRCQILSFLLTKFIQIFFLQDHLVYILLCLNYSRNSFSYNTKMKKRVWKWRYFEIRVSRRVKSGIGLRQAVRVAALSQACRCTVTHHCGMRGGYRINKGHMGKGRGGRKKWGWSKDLKHCEIIGEGIVWCC